MGSFVQMGGSRRLQQRLDAMQRELQPGSRSMARYRDDVARLVKDGNREGLLAGTDRYGRAMAPLAESTLRRRRGSGSALVPRGGASRFIRNFVVRWVIQGTRAVLVAGWTGMTRKGKSFAIHHITGTSRLPRRDPAGIRPATHRKIRERTRKLGFDVLRARGGA